MDPLIRWAGSKRKLLPTLKTFWGQGSRRYIEPFAGSACLFFEIAPQQAILGDLNNELIGTYETVRKSPDALHETLQQWRNDSDTYYAVRGLEPESLDPITRGARFLYLNRYCFNGIYRTNLSGKFNVPYGGQASGTLPSLDQLRRAGELLGRTKLVSGDFQAVLHQARFGDFVYIDPPFRVATRRMFRQYNGAEFSEVDLARLRWWLLELDRKQVQFLVSYADSREARALGKGFQRQRVRVRRNVAGFASDRRTAYEILISNARLTKGS